MIIYGKKKSIKSKAKKIAGMKVTIGAVVIAAIVCGILGVFALPQFTEKDQKQVVVNVSTLENVLKVSKLSTYETVYI